MPPTYSSAKLWTQVMTYPWKVLGLNMLPNLTLNWTEHWTWTISITIRYSICVDRTQLLRHLADLRIRYPVCNVNCKTGSVTERIRQSVSQSVSQSKTKHKTICANLFEAFPVGRLSQVKSWLSTHPGRSDISDIVVVAPVDVLQAWTRHKSQSK